MSNLIDKYGTAWFSNKFRGSFFKYEGMPAYIKSVGSNSVISRVMPHGREPVDKYIPHDYFVDSRMFAVPDLGYRHFNGGQHLLYFSRNNMSYRRGLAQDNIRSDKSDITLFLEEKRLVPRLILSTEYSCREILSPSFIPMSKGVPLALRGKLISFAVSPTVAVVPDPSGEGLSILVGQRVVGTVAPDGSMSFNLNYGLKYIEELSA